MPLTLDQIKDIIITNTKQIEICDTLHDANANVTVNLDGSANQKINVMGVSLETKENSVATIVQNNTSVLHLVSNGSSQVTHEGNDTSYGLAKLFHHSALVYTLNGSAQMVVKAFNAASINGVLT